jgi:hypothetical protein
MLYRIYHFFWKKEEVIEGWSNNNKPYVITIKTYLEVFGNQFPQPPPLEDGGKNYYALVKEYVGNMLNDIKHIESKSNISEDDFTQLKLSFHNNSESINRYLQGTQYADSVSSGLSSLMKTLESIQPPF